jgi:hypothetical protein
MLNLLGLAQKSQKELQKFISKKEVEEYTKGWNPWEEKRVLFPHTAKKNKHHEKTIVACYQVTLHSFGCSSSATPKLLSLY